MRKIVFDIETSNIFQDVSSRRPEDLDLSVIGIFDSADGRFRAFEQTELRELWPILENADLLVGFNSDHFDIPLLQKYYPGDISKIKSLDLLKIVRSVIGRRIKLDDLAQATLGEAKSGGGLDAIRWWREGRKDKVKEYCLRDVRLTRDLYEYARLRGTLKYLHGSDVQEFAVDSSDWEKVPARAPSYPTLPF